MEWGKSGGEGGGRGGGGEESDRGTGGVQCNYMHEEEYLMKLAFPRRMVHAVRLGFGLYRIVKDEQERKVHEDKAQSVQYSTSRLSVRQAIPQLLPQ